MKAQGFTKDTLSGVGIADRGFPNFKPGDAIRVAERISEGGKERIQYFEGDVIAVHSNGASSTFTIRKIGANSVAVEKIFPYYSPKISGIEFVREGDIRRAKLYYMRDRIGKAARVKEKKRTQEQRAKLLERLAGKASHVPVEKTAEKATKPAESEVSNEKQQKTDKKASK